MIKWVTFLLRLQHLHITEYRYETADGGGDGAMSFGYLEASMKGRKPAFWLKETMNQTDKKIVKTISWWKAAAEPVYALSSNSRL